jgi:hypothetical protein
LPFIQISYANEILSDPAARDRYDNPRPTRESRSSWHASAAPGGQFWDSDSDGGYGYFSAGVFFEAFVGRRAYNAGWDRAKMDEMKRMAAARKAAEETERKRFREEAAESERQAKEKAKEMEKERKQKAKEKKEKERRLQEELWAAQNATTEAEKRAICLHTDFWPKEQHKRKVKCDKCGHRRGMTGYKCPHCALVACQLCLNNFNAKRTAK